MSEALSILQISNRVPFPLNEGGTIGIFNYTRGFSEAGCDVTLLALSAKKHAINMVEAETALKPYCTFKWFPIDTDVKAVDAFLNLFGKKSYNVERFYDKGFEQAIVNELTQCQYDIIQIEGTFPAVYTETIIRYSGKAKVILRQHNVEYQIWQRLASNSKNPLKKWYFNLLSKRLKAFESQHLNQFDAVVPVTTDDGELFRQLGCIKPIFDSPAGIDVNYWKPTTEPSNRHKIYHIGSLEWMPNVEALMWFINDVWPILIVKQPSLEFHVAGKGMSKEIKEMQVDGVFMIGEVDDAAEFIADKSITVVPLKSGSGIRLKILEAMSAGKAVVSTTIGAQGIRYTAGKNIVVADEANHFADAVLKVYEHVQFCEDLQREARLLIETEYSNQGVVNKLLNFYRTL